MEEYGHINNHIRGTAAEHSFRLTAESRGWEWEDSNDKEDKLYHIDCHLYGRGEHRTVDVKAIRSYGKVPSNKRLTIEFVNARGKPGSLFGIVDWFAFELDVNKGTFLIVHQEPLLQLVMGNMCVLSKMRSRTGQNDFYTVIDTELVLDIGEVWERKD